MELSEKKLDTPVRIGGVADPLSNRIDTLVGQVIAQRREDVFFVAPAAIIPRRDEGGCLDVGRETGGGDPPGMLVTPRYSLDGPTVHHKNVVLGAAHRIAVEALKGRAGPVAVGGPREV